MKENKHLKAAGNKKELVSINIQLQSYSDISRFIIPASKNDEVIAVDRIGDLCKVRIVSEWDKFIGMHAACCTTSVCFYYRSHKLSLLELVRRNSTMITNEFTLQHNIVLVRQMSKVFYSSWILTQQIKNYDVIVFIKFDNVNYILLYSSRPFIFQTFYYLFCFTNLM